MNDFLKNLKKAVESGEMNKEIIDHHYDVLQGADMVDLVKANKKEEEKSYEQELEKFITIDDMAQHDTIVRAVREEEVSHIDEIITYADKKDEMLKKVEQAKIDAEAYELKRKKRELIEMNTAHIKLLEDENEELQKKILKNKELMSYLKTEMERE